MYLSDLHNHCKRYMSNRCIEVSTKTKGRGVLVKSEFGELPINIKWSIDKVNFHLDRMVAFNEEIQLQRYLTSKISNLAMQSNQ